MKTETVIVSGLCVLCVAFVLYADYLGRTMW